MEDTTKLIQLRVENILGVKAMALGFNGESAVLTGGNEAGKSSAINSLAIAIGQTKEPDPLHNGKPSGYVIAEFDKFTVSREFRRGKNSHLKFEAKEGVEIPNVTEFFKMAIDSLSFRPDKFINMKSKEQTAELCNAIGIDLDNYAKKRKVLYDERTSIGRDQKRVDGLYRSLQLPESGTPDEFVTSSDLTAKLETYRASQKERNDLELLLQTANTKITNVETEISELEEKLKNAKQNLANINARKEEILKKLEAAKDFSPEIEDTIKQITDLEKINNKIRAKKEWEKAKQDVEHFTEKYEELTGKIDKMDEDLKSQLSGGNLPEGMQIIDDEIFLNDIPFDKLSTSQKLSLSMKIGTMKQKNNGNGLKINILTMDASQYDEKKRQDIIDIANKEGFQLILEVASTIKPDSNGKIKNAKTFYIEDGMAETIE